MRELAMPVCLSAIGVRPWEWARLGVLYVNAPGREVTIPVRPPNRVWTQRTIKVPVPLWATMADALPEIEGGDDSVLLVHPVIADAYVEGTPRERQQVLRNLNEIASSAGVERRVSWRGLRQTYEGWLKEMDHTPETVDLMMGRRPKVRRSNRRCGEYETG